MRKILIVQLVLLLKFSPASEAQDAFSSFSDLHIHPTYKHYNRPKTAEDMKLILAGSDTTGGKLRFTPELLAHFQSATPQQKAMSADNWESYLLSRKPRQRKALQRGLTSDLRNYDQASYAELKYTPGSILCNSFYPFEKQYALSFIKRLINGKLVSKMGMRRLRYYSTPAHAPLHDFLAEYYFSQLQDSVRPVHVTFPTALYQKDGETVGHGEPQQYYSQVKLVRDNGELRAALAHNAQLDSSDPDRVIISPMLMTIEGAQVLYGPLSGRKGYIGKPQNDNEHGQEKEIREELLSNVSLLKNLPHRLFFITLGHFAQNHVVGFAKTIDRDPESYQHRLPALLSKIPTVRNSIVNKEYDGFNDLHCQKLGLDVVKAFVDPTTTKYGKPTYIDVKHMDVKARIQYYYQRRRLEKELGIPIPIVASHFAVSGEKQAMAAATGLRPNFDRYQESEDPRAFYKKSILKGEDPVARAKYWREGVMEGRGYSRDLNSFERAMYQPLNFRDPTLLTSDATYDPFSGYDLAADKTAGWFYPWSLNLFDEEIIEINKSDGIIGLLLDPRQLGAFAPNYTEDYEKEMARRFQEISDSLPPEKLQELQLTPDNLKVIEYLKVEPLLRNIFYIVRLTSYQQAAERLPDTERNALNNYFFQYTPDDVTLRKAPWDIVALGSDYDGLIDPIDFAPTASYLPLLHRRMVVYAYIFAQLHAEDFHEPHRTGQPLITSLEDSRVKMQKLFYENGKKFILDYF
ncbi:hypothetical protein H9Q13_06655 [Pontibacter sp. JH31]|uniref:Uncharacterized protein n=1 Tax=Pontibacter aquaedesilientis TaxID=2766980 RepID=A0ABR7XEX5_9BACT|nr:hypothetical protein [Pontibacter aquaedesilientis]MBD1396839.1 hypothetical protein [Pontibacter aquaedesilientis]